MTRATKAKSKATTKSKAATKSKDASSNGSKSATAKSASARKRKTAAGAEKRASSSSASQEQRDEGTSTSDHQHQMGLASISGVYAAGVGAASWFARRRGLPDHISVADLALVGIATHKLSRRVTKDSVTSPFRSPFVEVKGAQGAGELEEEVEGTGFRRAVGELVTCPFCAGQWIATGFMFGIVFAPRATRLVASVFSAAAISDFLQFAYAKAKQSAEQG